MNPVLAALEAVGADRRPDVAPDQANVAAARVSLDAPEHLPCLITTPSLGAEHGSIRHAA